MGRLCSKGFSDSKRNRERENIPQEEEERLGR